MAQSEKSQKDNSNLVVDFPRDSTTNEISYTEVVRIDSVDALQLYSKTKLFCATTFKDNDDLKQVNDDVAKTVILRPTVPIMAPKAYSLGYDGNLVYLLKVECKDNRYRYTLTDFVYHVIDSRGGSDVPMKISDERPNFFSPKDWHLIQFQTKVEAMVQINKLKKEMADRASDF